MRKSTTRLLCVLALLCFVIANAAAQKPTLLKLAKGNRVYFALYFVDENGKHGIHEYPDTLFSNVLKMVLSPFKQPKDPKDAIAVVCGIDKYVNRSFRVSTDKSVSETGYNLQVVNNTVFITARNTYAFENGLLSFLQQFIHTDILAPGVLNSLNTSKRKSMSIASDYKEVFNPSFDYRIAYYGSGYDPMFARFHKLSNGVRKGQSRQPGWGLWVHTMHSLVSPDKYFSTHPEYFALRNGVRVKDQPCFSNPEVAEIAIASLKERMKKDTAKYWSVSQMDNYNFCECPRCHHADSIDQSHCGAVLQFVNKVAAAFPDKVISTLAYQFSRKAPAVTRPLPNVNIMLCSIEENRARPIGADNHKGSFAYDLSEWTKITHNIVLWDYLINFNHIMGPFPNWKVIQPNIELFAKQGVKMMFQQAWASAGGEMGELRAYMVSRLLWNPELNTDQLIHEFCDEYYGPASPFVLKFLYGQINALEKSGKVLYLYEHPQIHKNGYLHPDSLRSYARYFDAAEKKVAKNHVLLERVQKARASLQYAQLEIAKSMPGSPDGLFAEDANHHWHIKPEYPVLLDTFVNRVTRYGQKLLHEVRLSPAEYKDRMGKYFRNGYGISAAQGGTITFDKPYAKQYEAGRQDALIDGFRGASDYQMLWQGWSGQDFTATITLPTAVTVTKVDIGFLQEQNSWIFLPKGVVIEVSTDGNTYTPWQKLDIPDAQVKGETEAKNYRLEGKSEGAVKYVRVKIANSGPLPVWHGSKGATWVFCDEIVINQP